MSRFELVAYLTAAILGGTIAGHLGGLVGVLGVFVGLGIVGFVEMLYEHSHTDGQTLGRW